MSVHPRSDPIVEDPPAKRAKLEQEPEQAPELFPSHQHLFNECPTGLFAVLKPTLGKQAAEEPQVGITEFVDESSPAFSGIIKHRFTDFLVYEIGLDGQVVRLKDIKGPVQERQPKPPKQASEKPATDAPVAPTKEPEKEEPALVWNEHIEKSFAPLLTSDKLDQFKQFVLVGRPQPPSGSNAKDANPAPTVFTTSPIEDKNSRGKFHQSIRAWFEGKLLSCHKELSTGDVVIEVTWAKGNVKSNNRGQRGASYRADEQELREARALEKQKLDALPPYIHFTLHKLNKESHDAIQTLSKLFNVTPRELGLAGTKDKRAVTVQRVSLKRTKNLTLEQVWKVARNQSNTGGGGRGGKGGRQGWIDRNVRIGDAEYAEHGFELGQLKGNRFVVTLRDIDPTSVPTIQTSMDSLRSHGFLNYYGMQRFGTAPIPTHLIGLALLRSEWEFAVDLILSERQGEQQDIAVARGLWKEGKHDEARRAMPKRCTAERSVMEAYKRGNGNDHLGALSSIPKNLRLMYVHAWQSYIWNRLVSERVKLFGAKEPVEGDLVYVEKDPSSAAAQQAYYISTSSLPKVRPLTAEDIAAKSHTIYDVVLPMPGFAVTYPGGKLGEMYKQVIRDDGIDPEKMWRKQKEYSLGGTYRKILHLPPHVSYKLLVSTSSQQDLAQSDEDVLLGKPALDIKEYDDKAGLNEGESLNLQVELELGSSTYATMALREILKSRTSAANQKSLTKEMEGRLETNASAESLVTPPQNGGDDTVVAAEEAEKMEA
ncbi:pseudouridine synthase PUS7 [Sporobolomyces koalae]|uniref:pseudouridine synthase PUS7 n=1 Tax=Sporobolomyces koalae TaxID=500713 RepID=UPI003175DB7E